MAQTNYAVPPGDYLTEWLQENDQSVGSLAFRLGVQPSYVTELVTGKIPLTESVAVNLASLTGIPFDSWMRIERKYRTDSERIATE